MSTDIAGVGSLERARSPVLLPVNTQQQEGLASLLEALEQQAQEIQDTFERRTPVEDEFPDERTPLLKTENRTSHSDGPRLTKPLGLRRTTSFANNLDTLVEAAFTDASEHDWEQVNRSEAETLPGEQFGSSFRDDEFTPDFLEELELMRPASPGLGKSVPLIAPIPRRTFVPMQILEHPHTGLNSSKATLPVGFSRQKMPEAFTTGMALSTDDPVDRHRSVSFKREIPKKSVDDFDLRPSTHEQDPSVCEEMMQEFIHQRTSADDDPLAQQEMERQLKAALETPLVSSPLRRSASAEALMSTEKVSYASQAELLKILNIPYRFKLLTSQGAQSAVTANEAALQLREAKTVTLGDLHGSYRKLVETLVAADLLTMPAEVARQFAHLASQPANFSPLTMELSHQASQLKQMVPFMKWKGGSDRKLILAGDVIGDRGPLDQVTLEIIHQLTRKQPDRIVRIGSNHDHNVLRYMTLGLDGMGGSFTTSMQNAYKIAMGPSQVKALREQYFDYLAHSKLMHYDPASKTLYTHAPVTKQHIKQLIELMKAKREQLGLNEVHEYEAIHTPEDLLGFVDQVNRFYQHYIRQAAEQKRLDLDIESVLVGFDSADGFLWSRSPLRKEDDLPFRAQGVERLVHGHDQLSQDSPFSLDQGTGGGYRIINLDQDTRKYDSIEALGETEWEAFYRENATKLKTESRLYVE
jgi:hypothetical protein